MNNKKKSRHINLYNNKTIQLSAILFSNIFSAKSKSAKPQFINFTVSRTKYEQIEYSGFELDCIYDFQLFSLILRKAVTQNYKNDGSFKGTLSFSQCEVYDFLCVGKNARRTREFEKLCKRVKKIEQSRISIDRTTAHKVERFSASFINTSYVNSDSQSKSLVVELNESLFRLLDVFNTQYIDISTFNELSTQYTRAIYLYLSTKRFSRSSSMFISVRRDELARRITHSQNLEEKKRNQIIRDSLAELEARNLIKGFEFARNAEMIKIQIKDQAVASLIQDRNDEQAQMTETLKHDNNSLYHDDESLDFWDLFGDL